MFYSKMSLYRGFLQCNEFAELCGVPFGIGFPVDGAEMNISY